MLVGPDMNRRLWGKYGKLAGLLTEDATGQLRWQEQIKYVFAEEDEMGIGRDDIKRLVTIADEIKADGLHPIFVIDSYRARWRLRASRSRRTTTDTPTPASIEEGPRQDRFHRDPVAPQRHHQLQAIRC